MTEWMTTHRSKSWETDSRSDGEEFSLPVWNLKFKCKREPEVDRVLSHTANHYSEAKCVWLHCNSTEVKSSKSSNGHVLMVFSAQSVPRQCRSVTVPEYGPPSHSTSGETKTESGLQWRNSTFTFRFNCLLRAKASYQLTPFVVLLSPTDICSHLLPCTRNVI